MHNANEVASILEPLHSIIHESVVEALRLYDTDPNKRYKTNPRTKANDVWDMFTNIFAQRAGDHVIVEEEHGSKYFSVKNDKGSLVFRFKKVDSSGNSRNFPTHRNSEILQGQLDLQYDYPAERRTVLEIGYELDRFGLKLERVIVKSLAGKWIYEIEEPKAAPLTKTTGRVKVTGKKTREAASQEQDKGDAKRKHIQ